MARQLSVQTPSPRPRPCSPNVAQHWRTSNLSESEQVARGDHRLGPAALIKTRLALIAERDDINAGAWVLMHVQALRHALARGDAAQAAWWTLRFACEALMLEQECKGWPQAIARAWAQAAAAGRAVLRHERSNPEKTAARDRVLADAAERQKRAGASENGRSRMCSPRSTPRSSGPCGMAAGAKVVE